MRWLAVLFALTGCELVFPLEGETCPVAAEPRCGLDDPDEDGDGLRDDCDPCPAVAGTADDTDADGIGDACDPAPLEAASCGAHRFFGFTSADGLARTAGWTFDGDAFVEDPDATDGVLVVLESAEELGAGRVTTLVDDGQLVGGNSDALAGVAMGDLACAIHPADSGTGSLVIVILRASGDQVLTETADDAFAVTPGVSHRLELEIDPPHVRCRSVTDGMLEAELTVDTTNASSVGHAGIVLRSSTSFFNYLEYVSN